MRIQIANAPCSWGALEFDAGGTAPGYRQVLDEMAASGYTGTELGDWGFMPTDPPALRAELAARSLALLAAFVPVRFTDVEDVAGGVQTAIQTAELLRAAAGGDAFIVLSDDPTRDPHRTARAGRIAAADSLDEAGCAAVADGAERIAREVRERTGLRTVFHHHCATFIETPWEIDGLLERTDPALLGLCFDTGHCVFGGGDPAAMLDKWGERVWHVHFKDCDPAIKARAAAEGWGYLESVRHGVFCELGRGAVDFPAVLKRLQSLDYHGWIVVEQDVLPSMGSPAASAARNRQYLRQLGV
jgi:inosose dehydratase